MKRKYRNDYPSITTLLSLLRKPQLENWFKSNTPQFINEESKKAKEIGTQLAEAIQAHIELYEVRVDTIYPEEIMNCLKSFMKFKKEYPDIKLHKAEIELVSETYKINGTLDCLGNDGKEVIWEWKSGKCKDKDIPSIYEEYIWQNAGYINLYNDIYKTDIQKGIVVVFAKDKIAYNLQTVTGEEIKEIFNNVILPLRTIWQYQKGG